MPVGFMNICFMTIMAGVITIAVPAVGTLLIFALAITPAATANIIARSPFKRCRRHGDLPDFDLGRAHDFRHVPRSPELHHRDNFDVVLGGCEGY